MPHRKTFVIGVGPTGPDSLAPAVLSRLKRADIVCGGQRLLDMFPDIRGERVPIANNLGKIADLIKANVDKKRIVILASGDPNFFGVARYLTETVGKKAIRIVPNISAMQLAFASIGESWDDATFVSAHGRTIEDIVAKVRQSQKVCIFTDNEHTPDAIAKVLLGRGISGFQAYVCENLGTRDQRVINSSLKSLCNQKFSRVNTLILIKEKTSTACPFTPLTLGIPDSEFYQRRPKGGLITKQEIRAISLAKMRLAENSIVWDIGAGSGALSIEASFFCRAGHVYAVEKNEADISIIRKNAKKFQADNVQAVHAFAPDGLDGLPAPSAVFIGGSGGRMAEILSLVKRRLKPHGTTVINTVTLENLGAAVKALKEAGFSPELTLANIARGTSIQNLTRLAALNPVFIVSASKNGEGER